MSSNHQFNGIIGLYTWNAVVTGNDFLKNVGQFLDTAAYSVKYTLHKLHSNEHALFVHKSSLKLVCPCVGSLVPRPRP